MTDQRATNVISSSFRMCVCVCVSIHFHSIGLPIELPLLIVDYINCGCQCIRHERVFVEHNQLIRNKCGILATNVFSPLTQAYWRAKFSLCLCVAARLLWPSKSAISNILCANDFTSGIFLWLCGYWPRPQIKW